MKSKFLRFTFLAVLCLSLAGKVLSVDSCKASEFSKEKSVVSYDLQSSDGDCSSIDCKCHCHHHHFDFTALNKSFVPSQVETENFNFDSVFLSPSLNSCQKRPPKLVA